MNTINNQSTIGGDSERCSDSMTDSNKNQQTPAEASRWIKDMEIPLGLLYFDFKKLVTPSEVPMEFHPFVFMNMLSALVGDKIYFKEGNDTFYPNLWTMLVGPSGYGRKSTGLNPEIKILAKAGTVNLLATKGSPEGFFQELADAEGVGLWRHSELGSLLGSMSKKYMGGMIEDLCEMYDPTSSIICKRLAGGKGAEIDHLAVSWIAATTPDSLNRCDASSRIATGFLPRWNIVFGSRPATYIHFRRRKTPEFFDAFVNKIKEMPPQKPKEMRFDEDAMDVHKKWYMQHRPYISTENLGCFQTRILEVVKKYAVLISFLHKRDTVSKASMSLALKFGDYFFLTAKRLISNELAEGMLGMESQKIVRALTRRGGEASGRDLMRATNLLKDQFQRVIDTMEARGTITSAGKGQVKLCEDNGK